MPEPDGRAARACLGVLKPAYALAIFEKHRRARSETLRKPVHKDRPTHMRIKLTSLMVDDQSKALRFYTEVLGFTKKHDIPVGEYRWITVAADGRDDVELALEPNANPAGKAFQEAMFAQGIPLAAFEVADIRAPNSRGSRRTASRSRASRRRLGPVTIAVFSDTCGNLIQLYQRT